MNTTITKSAVAAMLAVMGTGCASLTGGYPTGIIYDASTRPHSMDKAEMAGPAKTGDKVGEACMMGILSIVAVGDASIDAAKKAGGITDVHAVDLKTTNYVGVYGTACTVVHGK